MGDIIVEISGWDAMPSLLPVGLWKKVLPSDAFVETEVDIYNLVSMLDRRINGTLGTPGAAKVLGEFREWFSGLNIQAVVVFPASGILQDGNSCMDMHLVSSLPPAMRVLRTMPDSMKGLFLPSASDPELLGNLFAEEEGIAWGAFLSGELIVAGNTKGALAFADSLFMAVHRRFNEMVLPGLAALVAWDIRKEMLSMRLPESPEVVPESVDWREAGISGKLFERMAEKSMGLRRIDRRLIPARVLFPKVKEALRKPLRNAGKAVLH